MTKTEEGGGCQIPREFKISNPVPPISPHSIPELEVFPADAYRHYHNFVKNIIPKYSIGNNYPEPDAISSMKELFDQEQNHFYLEIEMHIFLVTCQNIQIKLMSNPSLTRLSILHHELYLASELIHSGKIKIELADFCNMMMADIVDLYHNHFSDILEQKFWNKNKKADDVVKHFLTKEFERLRNLNSYTYKQIVIVAMRKVIDSAQSSEVNKLISWAKANSISLDG